MGRQKSNLNCEFKLKPIITYHLWFVVKILWTLHFFLVSLGKIFQIKLNDMQNHIARHKLSQTRCEFRMDISLLQWKFIDFCGAFATSIHALDHALLEKIFITGECFGIIFFSKLLGFFQYLVYFWLTWIFSKNNLK